MSIKHKLKVLANATFGTWHLPAGLSLPPVKSSPEMMEFHQRMLELGDSKALSMLRTTLTGAFKQVSRISEINALIAEHERSGIHFYNGNGSISRGDDVRNIRSIFFPGSGVDRIRNFGTGLRDLRMYKASLLGHTGEDLEADSTEKDFVETGLERTVAYLYQTTTNSEKASRTWFQRLQDAYRIGRDPGFYSAEAEEFVDRVFIPRVTDPDQKNLRRTSVDKAAENMRMTLAGQSYGGTFCHMLMNCLHEKMEKLEYSNEEIQKVFDNMLVFSISGALPAFEMEGRASPKVIFVEHELDFVGFQVSRYGIHPRLGQREELRHNGNQNIINLSSRRRFYVLDFDWKGPENPDGVKEPERDSYGYHDLRAVLSALPEEVMTAVCRSLREPKKLPKISKIIVPEVRMDNGLEVGWGSTLQ